MTTPAKSMGAMTPRELLALLTEMGRLAVQVNASARPVAPAKGPRGLKRRAKRRRSQAKLMRERRSTLRSLTVRAQRDAS